MLKEIWKDYFSFSKKERNAVFILLSILLLTIVIPYFIPEKKLHVTIDEELQQQLDKYLAQNPRDNRLLYAAKDSIPAADNVPVLFQFDPNTLSEAGFKKLGLSDRQIHTLLNYRNKGGFFKTPQDIRKIYGLSKAEADRLIPYIKIGSVADKQSTYIVEKPADENFRTQQAVYKKIDINTATAEEWKALPGIGDVLSNRIVKFRTMRGGFKSLDDIRKTYGLSDSTFMLIKPYLVLKNLPDSVSKN